MAGVDAEFELHESHTSIKQKLHTMDALQCSTLMNEQAPRCGCTAPGEEEDEEEEEKVKEEKEEEDIARNKHNGVGRKTCPFLSSSPADAGDIADLERCDD